MDKLMSQKEVKRSQILDRLKEGKTSQQEAAQQMGISTRQVPDYYPHWTRQSKIAKLSPCDYMDKILKRGR
jgi:predicted transcriptional regulator